MLRIILPLAIVLIMALGGGALYLVYDYVNSSNTDMAGAVRADGKGEAGEIDPMATALRMVFEDSTGATTTQPQIDLRGLLPEAPDGWFRTGYSTGEGEAITGEQIIRSMVTKSDTNSLLLEFERAAGAGKYGEAAVYIRGPRRMAVMMRVPEQLNRNSVRGGLMAEAFDNINAMAFVLGDEEEEDGPFARVGGIAVEEQPRVSYVHRLRKNVPVDYRVFEMDVAGLVKIKILTNASDKDVADLLGKLDMAALDQKIGPGLSGILASAGVETAAATLATEPPGPGPMHRAYALVEAGAAGEDREGDIMRLIATGAIDDWDDVNKQYGRGFYNLTPQLTSLLGEEPDEYRFARTAQFLIAREEETGALSREEVGVLRDIISGRVETRRDALERKSGRYEWHAETIALLSAMPAGEGLEPVAEAAVESAEPAVRPAVNRGLNPDSNFARSGSCTIEFGVRRCTLTDG